MESSDIVCGLCQVRKSELFSDISQEHLCALNTDRKSILHKRGQTLFHEGTRPLGLFCINEGLVKVYKTGSSGKEQILRLAKAGDFLGYRALLSEEVYAASATILQDARICFIQKDTFQYLLDTNSGMQRRLLKHISQELGVMEDKLSDLSQRSVRERLAKTLLQLRETFGVVTHHVPGDNKIDITLSREDLANIVGTATETLIRLLSEFRADGFIEFEGKRIVIINVKGLQKTADFYGSSF